MEVSLAKLYSQLGPSDLGKLQGVTPSETAFTDRRDEAEVVMSDRARNYVKRLDNHLVTSQQKQFMFLVADYYNEQKGSAWPSHDTLAEDTGKSIRQVQRLIRQCELTGKLVYEPGNGRGNVSRFRFPELEKDDIQGVKGDTKDDTKGDIEGDTIRKNQEPGTNTPLTPLTGGDSRITKRDLRRFEKERDRLYKVNEGNVVHRDPPPDGRVNERTIFESACYHCLLNPADVRRRLGSPP